MHCIHKLRQRLLHVRHCGSEVNTAHTRNAQITAQTQANRNANSLVIQTETACRNWKSVEPITTVHGRSSC